MTKGIHARLLGRNRSNAGHEQGAVLVEAALIIPVILLLLLAILEFGFIFKDELTVANMTRQGAREGSADDSVDSDWNVVQSVKSAGTAVPADNIKFLVIFKANGTDATPPDGCGQDVEAELVPGFTGVDGLCNAYSGDELQLLTPANKATRYDPSSYANRQHWNATSRCYDLVCGPDHLGILVWVSHPLITGSFTEFVGENPKKMVDKVVFRLEPRKFE